MSLFLPYSPGRTPSEEITRVNVFLDFYSCIFGAFYVNFVFCDFLKIATFHFCLLLSSGIEYSSVENSL